MSTGFAQHASTKQTSQREKPLDRPEMVANSENGFVFQVDQWQALDRFLILGTEGGTYYITEQKLTKDRASDVLRCIQDDAERVVKRVVEISVTGRAAKNDPALFVLAMVAKLAANAKDRKLAFEALPDVARTGTHLLHFVQFVETFGGWGRSTRNGVANWFVEKDARSMAYQMLKYKSREGVSMRDVLRLCHAYGNADQNKVFAHVTQGWLPEALSDQGIGQYLVDAKTLQTTTDPAVACQLIERHRFTREFVNPDLRDNKDVLMALYQKMPFTALIRNLGNLSKAGLLVPLSSLAKDVALRLRNQEGLRKARVHPFQVLVALKTYSQGHGMHGRGSWETVPQVVEALNDAFYLSFQNVDPTGQNFLLGVDVSSSMSSSWGGTVAGVLTHAEAAAVMAMVTARAEKNYYIHGFAGTFRDLKITAQDNLSDVLRKTRDSNFGRTDCALPMQHATRHRLDVDMFCVYTDSETWCGGQHPFQALRGYRQKMGRAAKLVVVATAANDFTIADPRDAGMMDMVGFDSACPALIADFARQSLGEVKPR